jgi:quinol monooxygenase YgiN
MNRFLTSSLHEVFPLSDSTWIPPAANDRPNVDVSVHATLRMRIPFRKRKEARRILGSMIERIRLDEGCLGCRLYLDALEEGSLMLEEVWSDETSFEKHLRSEEFRILLLVMEMASGPPEIRFKRVGLTTGMDTIQTARNRKALQP